MQRTLPGTPVAKPRGQAPASRTDSKKPPGRPGGGTIVAQPAGQPRISRSDTKAMTKATGQPLPGSLPPDPRELPSQLTSLLGSDLAGRLMDGCLTQDGVLDLSDFPADKLSAEVCELLERHAVACGSQGVQALKLRIDPGALNGIKKLTVFKNSSCEYHSICPAPGLLQKLPSLQRLELDVSLLDNSLWLVDLKPGMSVCLTGKPESLDVFTRPDSDVSARLDSAISFQPLLLRLERADDHKGTGSDNTWTRGADTFHCPMKQVPAIPGVVVQTPRSGGKGSPQPDVRRSLAWQSVKVRAWTAEAALRLLAGPGLSDDAMELQYIKLMQTRPAAVFTLSRLGDVLADQLQEMKPGEQRQFVTTDPVCAVTLYASPLDGDTALLKVCISDPKARFDQVGHFRCASEVAQTAHACWGKALQGDPKKLVTLYAADSLLRGESPAPGDVNYRVDPDTDTGILVEHLAFGVLADKIRQTVLTPQWAQLPPSSLAQTLRVALTRSELNHGDALRALLQGLMQTPGMSSQQRYQLFAGLAPYRDGNYHYPIAQALWTMERIFDPSRLEVFVDTVLQAAADALEPEHRLALVTRAGVGSIPVAHLLLDQAMALDGQWPVLQAIGITDRHAVMPPDSLMEGAVHGYFLAVASAGTLTLAQKQVALTSPRDGGTASPAEYAMARGKPGLALAMLSGVALSTLAHDDKESLLKALGVTLQEVLKAGDGDLVQHDDKAAPKQPDSDDVAVRKHMALQRCYRIRRALFKAPDGVLNVRGWKALPDQQGCEALVHLTRLHGGDHHPTGFIMKALPGDANARLAAMYPWLAKLELAVDGPVNGDIDLTRLAGRAIEVVVSGRQLTSPLKLRVPPGLAPPTARFELAGTCRPQMVVSGSTELLPLAGAVRSVPGSPITGKVELEGGSLSWRVRDAFTLHVSQLETAARESKAPSIKSGRASEDIHQSPGYALLEVYERLCRNPMRAFFHQSFFHQMLQDQVDSLPPSADLQFGLTSSRSLDPCVLRIVTGLTGSDIAVTDLATGQRTEAFIPRKPGQKASLRAEQLLPQRILDAEGAEDFWVIVPCGYVVDNKSQPLPPAHPKVYGLSPQLTLDLSMRFNPPGWGAILVSTSGEKRPSPDSVGLALTLGSRYGMVAPREGLARHILEDKRYTPEERSHIVRGGLAAAASWAASDQMQYGPAQALLEAVLSASPGALALGTLGDLALARDTDAEKPYAHILMSQGPSIESHIAEIAERGFKTTAVGPHLKQARLGAIYHYYHAIGNAKTLTVGQKAQIICAKYGSPPLTAAQTALAANDYEALAVMAEAILCTGLPKSEQQIFLKQAGVDLNAILAHLRGKPAHALQYKTLHQAQKGGKPPGPMNPVKYEQTSEAMVLNTLRVRIMAEPSLKPPASTIPLPKPRTGTQHAQPPRLPDTKATPTKSTPPPRSTNPSDFEREFAKYGEKYADLHQAMESAISSGELDLADVDAGDVARVPLPLWRAYAKAIKAAGGRLTQINLPSGGATGSPENANLKKLVPDLAREFPRVQIWADENDGPLQAYIDRLSGRGPEAPPVERPLDETGLDTKSSVVVRPAPALTPMQIYDETLATLRGIKDHRKQCTELRQRIRPVFMAALTDSSRACEAAAILSSVVETSPTADATQGRLLGALGLTSKTADVVLIALHDSQHPEAPNWSIRLQGQQRMVHAALSKDKNTTVSESGRQGPAQRPDHKRASQPPRTVATPARPADIVVSPAQVLDYARSLGYGTGHEIFVPGDPDVKPHLHITKDFVSLKKRNGTHYDLYDHNGAHPERLVLAASQLSPHVDLDRQILEILDFMQGIPSPAQPR